MKFVVGFHFRKSCCNGGIPLFEKPRLVRGLQKVSAKS